MRWLKATTLIFIACSAAPHPAADPPAPEAMASEPPPPPEEALPAAAGDAVPPPEAEADAEGPSSCPEGMVLVEGDYCTEVRHECSESWYAPQNKKTVCESFEERATCVGERVPKRYCIDKYSWPNQEGVRPEVMNNFYQAQVKCAAAGKRMCTESEWTFACEGPEMKPFPYGYKRDPRKCNGDHPWDSPNMNKVAKRDPDELARLWRGVPSGSQPECVSDFGVHDLPANNDEVVSNEHLSGKWAKFSSVNTGGPWYRGVRNQCRPKIYTHEEGFYYYFLGFRCCSEADGAPNEPLTAMQQKRGQSMGYVERLARFTVDEMKEKLELKAEGKCSCEDKDVLCKTMCGTLLGPGARDADGSHLESKKP
jgi:formylglycine-generating enzyme